MKRFIILLVIVSILFSFCTVNVYASDNEYQIFLQGDDRWCSYVYGGSETIGSAGCAITSFAILMAYADDSLRDVNKFNPKICAKDYLTFAGDAVYWTPKKGPLTLRSDVRISNKEDVKKALDQGLYIILWGPVYSGTHYSPIVGWDEESDVPLVWDVAGGGLTWDDFTASGVHTGDIHVYESSKLSSKEAFAGATSYSEDNSEAQLVAYQNVVEQWELLGMPAKSDIAVESIDLDLPDSNDLTLSEKINLGSIEEGINSRHKTPQQVLNIVFIIVGFLLIIYTLLLLIGFVFDKTNTFLNLSLVSILTLGKLKIVSMDEEITPEMAKEGYVSRKALFVRSLVLFLLGGLLVSGVIPMLIMKMVYAII